MIVPMKKIAIIVQSKDADSTVRHLRKLGILHVEHQKVPEETNIDALGGSIMLVNKALDILQKIENSLGRTREKKWASRTIDLYILLFGNQIIDTPKLKVPHNQMHLRSFVLKGLSQLAPVAHSKGGCLGEDAFQHDGPRQG